MKVLITGAAGFLGRHFTKHHLEHGDEVAAFDDMSSPWAEFETWINERDARDVFETGGSYDIAYHFAAMVGGRATIEQDPLYNADSLDLDSRLFRWAADGWAGVVVYPSSSAVYGVVHQGVDGESLSEDMFHPSQIRWDVPDEVYGFTKMAGEFLAWKAQRYGVNTLCIRPFSGYGEDQSPEYPFPSIIRRVQREEDPITVWGHGEQTRDFIHVDDIVGATIARLQAGVKGYQNMNIGTGVATNFLDLASQVCFLASYDVAIEPQPEKPVGVLNRVADPSLMLEYYTPTVSLEEGIRRALGV